MSVGNVKTDGSKGSNYPWQLAMLQELGANNDQLKLIVSLLGGVPGVDYELWTSTYKANKAGTGYSTGDFIQRVTILDAKLGTIVSTVWFNETAGFTFPAPPQADLDIAVLPGGAQSIISSTESNSTNSPVAAGATSVGFTTSSTFVGNINGIARNASTFYGFSAVTGKTLPAITFAVTAGSVVIDKVV